MNSFRLVLCGAGLLAYLVTKHFTAPGEHGLPSESAEQLLGVRLGTPGQPTDPAILAWARTNSNEEPSFLPAIFPHQPEQERAGTK